MDYHFPLCRLRELISADEDLADADHIPDVMLTSQYFQTTLKDYHETAHAP